MLKVQLFGAGQATYLGRPLAGFPGQQCHLLLCYLLLNAHHSLGREPLAAVFWGDYPTATSRTYLRSALWRLRHAFDVAGAPPFAYVQVDAESVRFAPTEPYWSDTDEFQQATSCARDAPGESLTSDQAMRLSQAVDLYTGDLLEGVFEEWAMCERERLRQLYLDAVGKLGAYYEHNGSYELGLVYCTRMLCLDGTCESAHRQSMRLNWRMGNRHEALAQYKRCAQILHEELGLAPSRETRTLYEQMIHNRWEVAAPRHNGNGHSPGQGRSDMLVPARPAIATDAPLAARELQNHDAGPLAQDALAQLSHLQNLVKQSIVELSATAALIEQVLNHMAALDTSILATHAIGDSSLDTH
jgi:DNA-binding SARP family transcriptional activator